VIWTYPKNGREEITKRSHEIASIRKKKRGRPKLTWAEVIKGLMGEKGLMEEDWNDRSNWRKKIYLLNGRREMGKHCTACLIIIIIIIIIT
jgi:predicted adenine nucleotide alpha hydrolase (AANH) superfamily ATPase